MSEIDDWVDGLAGRNADKQKEADVLRDALIGMEASEETYRGDVESDIRFVALLSRLHREGLLEETQQGNGLVKEKKPIWLYLLPSMMAALLIVALGVHLMVPQAPLLVPHTSSNFDHAPRFRGISEELAKVHKMPLSRLTGTVAQLKVFGFPYQLRKEGEDWLLEFYVADISDPAASKWMLQEQLVALPTGWVRVMIKEAVTE